MREIVFDTETTGLDPATGDRIVEIGAVELFNHMPTGRTYHQYLNPQRLMPKEAFDVHGLGDDFLRDKPLFKAVAQQFLDFIGDATLIAHNASFDMKFLNAELKAASLPALSNDRVIDTVMIARKKFPGSPASLDALCRRYGVDNSAREKHGALLDSEILAEVYLELIGGRQPDFALAVASPQPNTADQSATLRSNRSRPSPLRPRITAEETAAHTAMITRMGDLAIWVKRT